MPKNPPVYTARRRRRIHRGFDGYYIVNMLEGLTASKKTPNALREVMRKLVNDDGLWLAIEEAHKANNARRLLTAKVEKRIQQL